MTAKEQGSLPCEPFSFLSGAMPVLVFVFPMSLSSRKYMMREFGTKWEMTGKSTIIRHKAAFWKNFGKHL